jgi:hypothetical protein
MQNKPIRKIAGVRERIEMHKARSAEHGDSWMTLKFAIAIVIAVQGFTIYVYYVRICARMLRGDVHRAGGVGLGGQCVSAFELTKKR